MKINRLIEDSFSLNFINAEVIIKRKERIVQKVAEHHHNIINFHLANGILFIFLTFFSII